MTMQQYYLYKVKYIQWEAIRMENWALVPMESRNPDNLSSWMNYSMSSSHP
jgi:hypothetical protein